MARDKPGRVSIGLLTRLNGMTRPDIANAVRADAHEAYDPAEWHCRAVRMIIVHPDKTKDLRPVFVRNCCFKFSVYLEAD